MASDPARAPALSAIVIRLGALGDMINLTALLHLLHRRYGRLPWSDLFAPAVGSLV